ncbi:carbohydrate binding domain-containing protein [Tamlana fucoidanivorans]|nr:carbohydrate binding domain-containing protein [Tamlana fucoidanivorans]
MKNKLILLMFLVVGALIGCQDDDYEPPTDLTDVGFYLSTGQAKELNIALNNFISFSDLSYGTTSHEWQLKSTGLTFLKGPIKRQDSILENFIIEPREQVSNAKTVHVYFQEAGMKEVRLYNTFKDSVTFRGNNGVEDYFVGSERINGQWVIDTTFSVKVWDTIAPVIKVRQNGLEIDHTSTDTIYVEAGDFLEFEDLTTQGEPTGRNWFVRYMPKEGVPSTPEDVVAGSSEQVANIIFKKLGVFQAGVNVVRSGQNIPGGSARYIITSPIKVIPSSKPFVVSGDVIELEDETIQVPFNGEFAPFVGQEPYFKVTVNGTDFSIASVELHPTDATLLQIKLNDPIYRPDVITVSYDGNGTLESTDTRKPVAFTDLPVIMHDVNMLPPAIASFEDGGNRWGPFTPAWGENQGDYEFTTDKAFKGDYSMKLTMEDGKRCAMRSMLNTDAITFEAGKKYVMRFSMYLESSTNLPSEISLWRLQEWANFWVNPDQVRGQWVTVEKEFTSTGVLSQLYFRILPNGAGNSDYVAYFDNFYINDVEERP